MVTGWSKLTCTKYAIKDGSSWPGGLTVAVMWPVQGCLWSSQVVVVMWIQHDPKEFFKPNELVMILRTFVMDSLNVLSPAEITERCIPFSTLHRKNAVT